MVLLHGVEWSGEHVCSALNGAAANAVPMVMVSARSGSLRDAVGFSITFHSAVTTDAMRGYFQRFVGNTPSFVVIDWRHFTREYGMQVMVLLEYYVQGNQQRVVFIHSYGSVPYIHTCCMSVRPTRVLILCG